MASSPHAEDRQDGGKVYCSAECMSDSQSLRTQVMREICKFFSRVPSDLFPSLVQHGKTRNTFSPHQSDILSRLCNSPIYRAAPTLDSNAINANLSLLWYISAWESVIRALIFPYESCHSSRQLVLVSSENINVLTYFLPLTINLRYGSSEAFRNDEAFVSQVFLVWIILNF